MSRLVRSPIIVPSNVKFNFNNHIASFDGPLGKKEYIVSDKCDLEIQGSNIFVKSFGENVGKEILGTTKRNLENACEGVCKGFSKKIILKGVGYKAAVEGSMLKLNVGYSHPIEFSIPEGIKISINKNTELTLSGIDKNLVGSTAAKLKSIRKPEPYKGSGIRIEGEYIIMKKRKKK